MKQTNRTYPHSFFQQTYNHSQHDISKPDKNYLRQSYLLMIHLFHFIILKQTFCLFHATKSVNICKKESSMFKIVKPDFKETFVCLNNQCLTLTC